MIFGRFPCLLAALVFSASLCVSQAPAQETRNRHIASSASHHAVRRHHKRPLMRPPAMEAEHSGYRRGVTPDDPNIEVIKRVVRDINLHARECRKIEMRPGKFVVAGPSADGRWTAYYLHGRLVKAVLPTGGRNVMEMYFDTGCLIFLSETTATRPGVVSLDRYYLADGRLLLALFQSHSPHYSERELRGFEGAVFSDIGAR